LPQLLRVVEEQVHQVPADDAGTTAQTEKFPQRTFVQSPAGAPRPSSADASQTPAAARMPKGWMASGPIRSGGCGNTDHSQFILLAGQTRPDCVEIQFFRLITLSIRERIFHWEEPDIFMFLLRRLAGLVK